MSEDRAASTDLYDELAARLADPPPELLARVALLDETVGRLQAALGALDGA